MRALALPAALAGLRPGNDLGQGVHAQRDPLPDGRQLANLTVPRIPDEMTEAEPAQAKDQ
jgi:hypothetical protein